MSGHNNCIDTAIPFTVAEGGTGKTSFVAYTPICGGTSSSSAFQSVASLSTAGKAFVSGGASTLPTFTTPTNTNGIALQCVQTALKTYNSFTSATFTPVGLSASITPASTSNKVLVMVSVSLAAISSSFYIAVNLMRGATAICQNTDASVFSCTAVAHVLDSSALTKTFSIFYIDSPATVSSTAYSIDAVCVTATGTSPTGATTFNINTSGTAINNIGKVSCSSTITLMELS